MVTGSLLCYVRILPTPAIRFDIVMPAMHAEIMQFARHVKHSNGVRPKIRRAVVVGRRRRILSDDGELK
jgi:hypothetical protein